MRFKELKGRSARLINLNKINVIVGRNGSGKSRFLRGLETFSGETVSPSNIKYISPERAGSFKPQGIVISNMSHRTNWLEESRRQNQVDDFKAASAVLLKELENLYNRRILRSPELRSDPRRSFETDRLHKINELLSNIVVKMGHKDLEFHSLDGEKIISPEDISSGESEAVTLATEIFYFFDTLDEAKFNVLLLDEPDVHLHPDLQARIGNLILAMLDEFGSMQDRIAICIATHSSPLICSFARSSNVSIGTKNSGNDTVELRPIADSLRKIAPFIGHPLSLYFSDDAPLILEGEDDERVWQQAARTSHGEIKVFPIVANGSKLLKGLEDECVKLLKALYDDPIAFSIRDGDGVINEPLEPRPPLRRFRLQCYAVENLLVTDPCLSIMGTTWDEFVTSASKWIEKTPEHKSIDFMQQLIGSAVRLRHNKIKDLRHIICEIADCKKPWEAVVGKAIAQLRREDVDTPNMLVDFLGKDLVDSVIFRGARQQESPVTQDDDTEQSLASVGQ